MYARNGDLDAQFLQQADTIHNHFARSATEHGRAGDAYLERGGYAGAARCYRAALDASPDDAELRFRLALSLLDGRRPHRHGRATLRAVLSLLRGGTPRPEAVALQRLIEEDHALRWRHDRGLAPDVEAEVARVDPARAAQITVHVPARGARVWQALRDREGG